MKRATIIFFLALLFLPHGVLGERIDPRQGSGDAPISETKDYDFQFKSPFEVKTDYFGLRGESAGNVPLLFLSEEALQVVTFNSMTGENIWNLDKIGYHEGNGQATNRLNDGATPLLHAPVPPSVCLLLTGLIGLAIIKKEYRIL